MALDRQRFWLPLPRRSAPLLVVIVGFLALASAAGARMTPGLIMVPLELHFGWSRPELSFAMSINLMLFGIVGPFAAAAMGRFGIRKVMLTGLALTTAAAVTSQLMSSTWQYVVLWGVATGIGTGTVGPVLASALAARWFAKRQGLVVGIFSASNAVAALIILPLLARPVQSGAWIPSVTLIASICFTIMIVAFLLLPERPEDIGGTRHGEEPGTEHNAIAPTLTAAVTALRSAIQAPMFWLLAGSFFVCGLTTNGLIGSHMIALCSDHNIAPLVAAGLMSLMGIFDLVGTLIAGWLSDRMNAWRILVFLYLMRGVSLLLLPLVAINAENLTYFVAVFGLNYVATVPPTVKLTNRHFGDREGPIVFGWIMIAHQLGAAVAAYGGGVLRAMRGDYSMAFTLAGGLAMLAGITLLFSQGKWKIQPAL